MAMAAGEGSTRDEVVSMLAVAALAKVAAAMGILGDPSLLGSATTMVAFAVDMDMDQGVRIQATTPMLVLEGAVATSRENPADRQAGVTERMLGTARTTIFSEQTVQAVVAAVTAATKANEPPAMRVSHVADSGMAVEQQVGMPAAAPNVTVQQPIVTGQEAQVIHEAGAKGKDNEVQGPPKKKKEEKTGCFRCKQPRHYIDDCPTPFCDICESIHHATSACHLLNAPKPTAILHGYANEALMFFELSCGAFKAKAENPKLAKVTVDGDAMTIPQLIEQLKKIVPSEKFVWEVFHFKDNVYRVKLPSKLDVQRLKNFGTYICTDRDSHLTFDLWSSLEEPLYMLPEVWVRVSGLPSDIRSDFLSLWGVGTLFGKTMEVDMAYTRKNKVLRIKIGCLDSNLIPEDSDMFIRRGFFKLRFEVEVAQSQEVNMMDATNGNDGNDDAQHGEGKNSGGHAMDMESRGNDLDAPSNNDEQGASDLNNDVVGMQEQLGSLDAIQIGSMHVTLSPTGLPSYAKNLNKNESICKSLSCVEEFPLKDTSGTFFDADLRPRGSPLGSSLVSGRETRPQSATGQQVAGVLQRPQVPASGSPLVGVRETGEQPASGQPVASGQLLSPVANGASHVGRKQQHQLSANDGDQKPASSSPVPISTAPPGLSATRWMRAVGGSSVPGELLVVAKDTVAEPQKIQGMHAVQSDVDTGSKGTHVPMIANTGACVAGEGSAVHAVSVDSGMFSVANFDNVSFLGNVELCNPLANSNLSNAQDGSYNAGLVLEPELLDLL
ncbi:hypothetical protein ACQ4PT_040763 [Festuca glaucescens]